MASQYLQVQQKEFEKYCEEFGLQATEENKTQWIAELEAVKKTQLDATFAQRQRQRELLEKLGQKKLEQLKNARYSKQQMQQQKREREEETARLLAENKGLLSENRGLLQLVYDSLASPQPVQSSNQSMAVSSSVTPSGAAATSDQNPATLSPVQASHPIVQKRKAEELGEEESGWMPAVSWKAGALGATVVIGSVSSWYFYQKSVQKQENNKKANYDITLGRR